MLPQLPLQRSLSPTTLPCNGYVTLPLPGHFPNLSLWLRKLSFRAGFQRFQRCAQDQGSSHTLAHEEKVSALDACNQLQQINARATENLQKMIPRNKPGVADVLRGRRTSGQNEPPQGHCADEPRASQKKVQPRPARHVTVT